MRKKTEIISILISIIIAAGIMCAVIIRRDTYADASATAEIAMELQTGTVLKESNADLKLPMASTTKIMTAIIIVEDCDLNKVITVPDAAVGVEGSSIYLKKGEEINVKDLLYGLMLRSGNDAAAALAIHHSGSAEKFVEAMNERAKKIGAHNTSFKNPSGLPDDQHYTTARDLCEIARYAMRNKTFKEVVSAKSHSGEYRSFINKNKMLYNYDGANGVKTGYTMKAGRCLVTSAERNGMDVVCVVLNCPDMYVRSGDILDACFNDYNLIKINENNTFMSGIVLCKPVKSGFFVAKKNEKLDIKVTATDKLEKICKGDLVAELNIYGQNGLLFSEKLYSIVDRNN